MNEATSAFEHYHSLSNVIYYYYLVVAFIDTHLKQKYVYINYIFIHSSFFSFVAPLCLLHSLTIQYALFSCTYTSCPHVRIKAHTRTAVCYSNAAVFNSPERHQGVLRNVSVRESKYERNYRAIHAADKLHT